MCERPSERALPDGRKRAGIGSTSRACAAPLANAMVRSKRPAAAGIRRCGNGPGDPVVPMDDRRVAVFLYVDNRSRCGISSEFQPFE